MLKKAQKEIDDLGKENVDLICIGKKARDHFRSREYNIISEYLDFWNELSFDHAIQYGKEIVDRFVSGEADHVQVVYNEFVSVATQTVISEQLLPLEYDQEEHCYIIEGRVQVVGPENTINVESGDYIIFPKGLKCNWNVTKPIKKYYTFK